jgi:hypothetical protein
MLMRSGWIMRAGANVWSAAVPQVKSGVAGWSAQMYSALVGDVPPGHDGMRRALFLIN